MENLIFGLPSNSNSSRDVFGGRQVVCLETNVGSSKNRISFSAALCEELLLDDDNVYVKLGYSDQNFTNIYLVESTLSENEALMMTKRNGNKPRSISNKKLHAFLADKILGETGELTEDREITVETGDMPNSAGFYVKLQRPAINRTFEDAVGATTGESAANLEQAVNDSNEVESVSMMPASRNIQAIEPDPIPELSPEEETAF